MTGRATLILILALAGWVYLALREPWPPPYEFLRDALELVLPFTLAFAIFFSMNILPRENESRTMEVFFSLPVRRYRLVIWHLTTVCMWMFLLLLVQALVLYRLNPAVKVGAILLHAFPAGVCVSCLTLWISTYTRNGPGAGFIAALICALHYYHVESFGPIQLFRSPTWAKGDALTSWGTHQVALVGLLCLLLIAQVNARLKKSELWFQ